MKNITYVMHIDTVPIYRSAKSYYTPIDIKHTGGSKSVKWLKLGNNRRSVLRYFIKRRFWAKRFFNGEMCFILMQWDRLLDLQFLFPRRWWEIL